MSRRRFTRCLLVAALCVAAWFNAGIQTAHAAQISVAQAVAIADAAWPGSPCAGKVRVTVDPTLTARGHEGEATGLAWTDDRWTLAACILSVAPELGQDPARRCDVIVHEVGHLAGHMHAEGGVMSARGGSWPACNPPMPRRERAERAVRATLPYGGLYRSWRIHCNARLTACSAVAPDARKRCHDVVLGATLDAADIVACEGSNGHHGPLAMK